MKPLPASGYRDRLARLRAAFAERRLGAFLAVSREDVHWLSGFTGSDSALLVTRRHCLLLTDFRYVEEAARSAPLAEVRTAPSGTGLWRFAGELARKAGAKGIGAAGAPLSWAAAGEVRKGFGGRLVRADGVVEALRMVKDAAELQRIRSALACAEAAFLAVRRRLRTGMTETDLKLDLEWEMMRRGASGPSFETIVAFGPQSSLPHAHAGGGRLRPGVPLLVDWGARRDFYCSDATRVLFWKDPGPRWRRRYELVLAAQRAGREAIRAGALFAEPDRAAREVFRAAGCVERFGHSLGHGVGLAVHDPGRLHEKAKGRLKAGMVLTVEPGLYYPRQGGIRIEDMVAVTEAGCETLSTLPSGLEWAILG